MCQIFPVMTNSVDPDNTALRSSLLDLHCLFRHQVFGVFILFQDYSIADMSSYTKNPIQRFEDQTLNRGMIMSPLSNLSMKVHVDEQLILSPEINVVSLRGLLTYKMPKETCLQI